MVKWLYGFKMPGYGWPNPYLCDDCVIHPSNTLGCSCNWHNLKDETPEGVEWNDWKILEFEGDEYMEKITREEGYWIYLDERGRPYPCVEYEYDKDGFDIPTFFSELKWKIEYNWFLIKHKLKNKF